ncbi:oligosaccharide repeat unit polymerase [Alphaproteobacteria bacterium]|nr:oligosaccharide repeat unit polymerase [Alphaproteobacteria bacterium]
MEFTEAGVFLFLLWCFATCSLVHITRDLASPPLMYLAVLGFFWGEIFVTEQNTYIYALYVLSILIVCVSSLTLQLHSGSQRTISLSYEASKSSDSRNFSDSKLNTLTLWVVSIPALICIMYLIQMFGGLVGYLAAAQHGTKYFHGLGPLKVLISTLYPVSLFYFAVLIQKSRSRSQYLIFVIHLSLVLLLALLSLSRGTLLTHFVFMGLIWHFGKRKLPIALMAGSLITILALASVYGVVRETFHYDGTSLELGIENQDKKFRAEWLSFGIFPLKRVLDAPSIDKRWGQTYTTAITNFVPRKIWPNKPDPGGVVFTNEYAPELYDKYSHYTTGIYPEAIINFGIPFGVIFGASQLSLLTVLFCYFYKSMKQKVRTLKDRSKAMMILVIYVYAVWGSALMITGEFTSIVVSTAVKVAVIILTHYACKLSWRSKVKKTS